MGPNPVRSLAASEINPNDINRHLYRTLEMRKIPLNLLKCQRPFPVLIIQLLHLLLKTLLSDDIDTGIDLVQIGIRSRLKLQQVDPNERPMPKTDLNSHPFLHEIHLCGREPRFPENKWLAFPSLCYESLFECTIEFRPGKRWNVDSLQSHFLTLTTNSFSGSTTLMITVSRFPLKVRAVPGGLRPCSWIHAAR